MRKRRQVKEGFVIGLGDKSVSIIIKVTTSLNNDIKTFRYIFDNVGIE